MILPTEVLEIVNQELNNNLVNVGLKVSTIGSEDLAIEDLQPPHSIVWATIDDDAEIMDLGNPASIPITIGVTIASGEFKSAIESMEQVLKIGTKIIKLLVKEYEVDNDDGQQCFSLRCKPIPMRFGLVSSALSSLMLYFTYEIDFIYGS